jgi:hypothetical protein
MPGEVASTVAEPMPFDLRDPEQLASRAPAYELAFAEAGRSLDAQERAVSDLTSRAGVLMAAAAVTTSIFGGQVLAHHRTAATWIALGAFVGVAASFVMVLWPRHEWEFNTQSRDLLTEYVEPAEVPLAMIHRDIAIHRAASIVRNRAQLRRLLFVLRVGMCLLVAEVVGWVVALTGAA